LTVTKTQKIKLLAEALQNVMGHFDNPIARRKIPGESAELARESGRVALKALTPRDFET
jgi:hypothetical protein